MTLLPFSHGFRRKAAVSLLAAMTPGASLADCGSGHIPEPREQYVSAISSRLARLGVGKVVDLGTANDFDVLAIPATATFLYLKPPSGPIGELSYIVHAPIFDQTLEIQRTIVAFTLARYASITETQALTQVVKEENQHLSPGTWIVRIGDAVAVYTRNKDGLIAKFGVCN